MNTTQGILVASMLLVAACDTDRQPTESERDTTPSQVERDRAEAARKEADARKRAERMDDKRDTMKDRDRDRDTVKDRSDRDFGEDWRGPERDQWHSTFTTFADGKDKTVDVGEWTIERGEAGMMTASRKMKAKADATGDKLSDVTVLSSVKSKLIMDPDIKARDIDVDVKDSVVTLNGAVSSAEQAAEAMRIALGTKGVDKVVSKLTWSTRRM